MLNLSQGLVKVLQDQDEAESSSWRKLNHWGKAQLARADETHMFISEMAVTGLTLILALILFTLYMMRRRSRQGLRTPKF